MAKPIKNFVPVWIEVKHPSTFYESGEREYLLDKIEQIKIEKPQWQMTIAHGRVTKPNGERGLRQATFIHALVPATRVDDHVKYLEEKFNGAREKIEEQEEKAEINISEEEAEILSDIKDHAEP